MQEEQTIQLTFPKLKFHFQFWQIIKFTAFLDYIMLNENWQKAKKKKWEKYQPNLYCSSL